MPTTKGREKYAIVAVDYFTKWVEAKALVRIIEAKTTDFIRKSIIYRFGVPNAIVTDNGTHFDNTNFQNFCDEWNINCMFTTPAHPQTNGQVEAVNKIIKHNIKAKLDVRKGCWVDLLPEVL